jgi:hypothetical protein
MTGVGNREYTKILVEEGHKKSTLEAKGNERYLIYFGRAHLEDVDTGFVSRGHMKIGRGKFMTALMRGRNQPGVDFRVYAEMIVETNEDTHAAEKYIKAALRDKNVKMSQGQQELYRIPDSELLDVVTHVSSYIKSRKIATIKEINSYADGMKCSLDTVDNDDILCY